MQRNIKVRNNSQHHSIKNDTYFGYGNPQKKPKMRKPVQQSDIDFIMKKYGTFTIIANSPKPGKCSYTVESLGKTPDKPQHPLA